MIDLNNAKVVFDNFVAQYDMSNPITKSKYYHTLRVVELCRKIGESLFLTNDDLDLICLIGLLHDVGRFEQVKRYKPGDLHNHNLEVGSPHTESLAGFVAYLKSKVPNPMLINSQIPEEWNEIINKIKIVNN